MKKILLLSLVILACKGGNENNSSTPVDPIYGEWYYEAPGTTSNTAKGIIAKIEADGNISYASVYAYVSGSTATYYVRKSIGKFVRNGDAFKITYSYETCDPVGSETLNMKVVNGNLVVEIPAEGVTLSMAKPENGKSSIQTAAMIEDKNCNILAKLEAKNKRIPASVKSKSFFDRALK